MSGQHTAYIALGSNLAAREANLAGAIERLIALENCRVLDRSPFLHYPAEGARPGAPDYLNAAVALESTLSPFDLLRSLQQIECAMGRAAPAQRPVNGDRVIDLDLLLYDQALIVAGDLVLPHPRMHRRRFVLEPLATIAPDAIHPVLQRTVQTLLDRLNTLARAG